MRSRFWSAGMGALALLSPALTAQSDPQPRAVLFSDFEDGTLQGWHARGTGDRQERLEVTSLAAHSGTKSVRISRRTTTWQGPQHLLADPVNPGDQYQISVWMYYDEGPEEAVFTLSVERSFADPAAGHQYHNITAAPVKKGEWTRVTADYTVPQDPTQKRIEVYIERPYKEDALVTPADTLSFYIDDVMVSQPESAAQPTVQETIPRLVEAWREWLTIGAAVDPDQVDPSNPASRLITKHFGALTAGNAMKWESLQPEEGRFRWEEADRIAAFAARTGMRLRGHTLLWHNQTPDWVFQNPQDPSQPASKELLLKRLKTHIQTVVGHFKGKIDSWDVVNEVVSDRSGLRTGAEGSRWFQILGADYIEQAFRWAHEIDPGAVLVLNDYNFESDERKRGDGLKLVTDLRNKGVPVEAVGLQMHLSISYPDLSKVRDTIAAFAALGVRVQVTELDVSIYTYRIPQEAKKAVTAELLEAQAQRYKDLFAIFREASSRGWLDLVVLWGVDDQGSWLNNFPVPGRPDAPLLFDRRLQAKPAFWALVEAVTPRPVR